MHSRITSFTRAARPRAEALAVVTAGAYWLPRARRRGAHAGAARCPAEETVVFAGGCFWGVQAVFQRVKGVTKAVSGYAGGSAGTARYELVSRGTTGHAESVQVTWDPARVSYAQLLQVFFTVAHDPTELNRQGPDVGTQYRSAIFFTTPAQKTGAQAYIDQLAAAKKFPARDRDPGRAARRVLPGRGLPPGLLQPAPRRAVHRVQRLAEGRQPAEGVSEPLRREVARARGQARRATGGRRPSGRAG